MCQHTSLKNKFFKREFVPVAKIRRLRKGMMIFVKKEIKPSGMRKQGIQIKGNFVESEKQAVYKKNIYKKLLKTKPCGFHRVVIDHLCVKAGTTTILENVSLSIACGALTVIIGKNGAGKSTLIKSILKEVSYEGIIEFRDLKDNTIGNLRVGYVPQHLNIEKNAPVSVYDLVAAYTSNVPVFLRKSKKLYEEIKERLALFDGETLIDKQVGDLSLNPGVGYRAALLQGADVPETMKDSLHRGRDNDRTPLE